MDVASRLLGKLAAPDSYDGFWGTADWLYCRDDKWRPVEPGTLPLVNGSAADMGRFGTRENKGWRQGELQGYGNALNAGAAIAFIMSYIAGIHVPDVPDDDFVREYLRRVS